MVGVDIRRGNFGIVALAAVFRMHRWRCNPTCLVGSPSCHDVYSPGFNTYLWFVRQPLADSLIR